MNREGKRARTGDGNFSNAKYDAPRFKQRFSNQGSSSAPRVNKDRVSNPKPQGGNSGGSSMSKPTCAKCGKKHDGKCLVDMDGCYGCGKSGYRMRDCHDPRLSPRSNTTYLTLKGSHTSL
ncbi:hypothetical protein R3W88_024289 [Solanum pinnatisectum]|uniref:CCHC-type domain-containing protein n=1 Tax=Solanum pinnatisectum TaxID=50273 RepID=A0AAV9M060_9SOLN|nr:hypothetical protein R3W88_024289 [Solanum pinnatisectum]